MGFSALGIGGVMGLFDKFAILSSDIITLPVSITKDFITMGGVLVDEESSTTKKLKKIIEDLDELAE